MTPALEPDPFPRLLRALEPWLGHIVIIGGWAHRLYRLHPLAQGLDYPPLMTLDTDIAVPSKLPAGDGDIRQRLLSHGFTEEFLGDDRPPATHYHLGGGESGFYAEFITPLLGGEYGRDQRRKATASVAGVTSQQLRHIELLLHSPWQVHFESAGRAAKILIPNPASFIAQKVLIHRKRDPADRAKDILYIHDTLELFGSGLAEIRTLWRNVVKPQLHPRDANTVSRASAAIFGQVSDDISRAAGIAAGRDLSPSGVREACNYGFAQVFS